MSAPFIFLSKETASGPFALALSQAAKRSVRIDIISTTESIAHLKASLPGLVASPEVSVFRPRAEMTDSLLGSHAKLIIADENYGYIGSANLTDPGLMNNLEMGVVVQGNVARAASNYWKELERLGFLERVD